MADNTINGKIAKDVFEAMVETGEDPAAIVDERACARSPTPARSMPQWTAYLQPIRRWSRNTRTGKDKVFGVLVGQTMKAMAGKGNPALINEALKRRLA